MASIPKVAEKMETVLNRVPNEIGCSSGFVKRNSKLNPAIFVQTVVLGWLQNPDATLEALTQTAAALGVGITPQGFDQRFGPEAAELLRRILESAVTHVVSADPVAIPVLQRFSAVSVIDSSTISLPSELATVWRGCGGNVGEGEAALKMQLRLDVSNGTLEGPLLQNGRDQDRSCALQTTALPIGALRLADLGYFNLDVMADLDDKGVFFLSRLQARTVAFDDDGHRLDLLNLLRRAGPAGLDVEVYIGIAQRLRVRLLAVRVPEEVANERRRKLNAEARHKGQAVSKARLALADWTIYVTNAPAELLSLQETMVLARVRWQIELLFKLWKQHGRIDESRSEKPWRILCEIYAKLTAMVIQHWLFLTGFWAYPGRSWVKAAQTVRAYAIVLVNAMAGNVEIAKVIGWIDNCLAVGCRMNSRRKEPNTYQLLLDLENIA